MYAPDLEEILQATRGRPGKFKPDPEDVRLLADLIEGDGEDEFEIGEQRNKFHLPGQHEQQSHAGDEGAKVDPRAARVAAGILRKLTPYESQHKLFRPKQGVDHRADYENVVKALHAALLGTGHEVESTRPNLRGSDVSRIYRKGDTRIEVDGNSRPVEFQPNMPSSYNNQREYTLRVRQVAQRAEFHLPGQHDQQDHDPRRSASKDVVELYHGTASNLVESVKKHGLFANESVSAFGQPDRGRAVYVSKDFNSAFDWAELARESSKFAEFRRGQSVVFHIRMPRDKFKKLSKKDSLAGPDDFSIKGVIEPKYIMGYTTGRGKYHSFSAVPEDVVEFYVVTFATNEARADFHLPGQHDQQTHAGEGATKLATGKALQAQAGALAQVAQKVYDAWDENEDEYAGGGICHLIAEEIAGRLQEQGVEANTVSAQIGDQHVWVVAQLSDGVYNIDIPPSTYETGGGYSWQKLPGVTLTAGDVVVERIDADPAKYEQYLDFTRADFHLPGQHDQQSHAGDDARNEASGGGLKTAADGKLPDTVVQAFVELGEAQRGKPETAMTAYQREFSGVMNTALEHTGDLTHRMTHMLKWGDKEDGREYVLDKTEKVLRWLTSKYGFDREHEENLAVVAKTRFGGDAAKAQARATELMNAYADRHAELPVYNRAQWLGREAAIQLGRGNTWGAVDALRELKGMADDAAVWNRNATAYQLGPDGKPRPYVSDRAPKSFAREDFHLPGQHDQADHGNRGDGTLDKRGSGPGRRSKPDPARIAEVTAIAKELGIKRFEIRPIPTPQNSWFSDVPPDAIIMGQYAVDSRTVRYNTEALKFPDRLVKDILRHEGGHADFHAAFRSRASGVRDYVKKNEKRLATEGRISAYARMYWRDYDDLAKEQDNPEVYKDVLRWQMAEAHDLAVNESFAELRRRFPDKPEKWPPSYRKLDALVRKHHARA